MQLLEEKKIPVLQNQKNRDAFEMTAGTINFLITRPLSSAINLRDKIAKKIKNINIIIFPAIDIIEIKSEILSQIDLSQIDMMIFISPAAVEHSANFIKKIKNKKNHIIIFSIGKDTAGKIGESGLAWSKVIYPTEKFNSEALLDLKELKEITNKNIMIFKGAGGNASLSEMLKAREANVIEAVVYERRLPKPDILPDLNHIDLILCTSSESMNNLISLLGDAVKEKRLLVSSEKLVLSAKTLGFKQTPLLAQNAGDEALIDALSLNANSR